MPSAEEEFSKLHDDITRFLNEEGGVDSGDEDVEVSQAPRARPGSITPLGVRVDRGAGLLGINGVKATIGEMDSVLINIRAWKQRHEREMLELRQRNEQALSQVGLQVEPAESPPKPPEQQLSQQPAVAGGGSSCGSTGHARGAAGPRDHLARGGAVQQPQLQQQQQQGQQVTDGRPLPPPLQLGEEEDEDLAALLRERRERRDRILSGSAAARLQAVAAGLAAERDQEQDRSKGQADTAAAAEAKPQRTGMVGVARAVGDNVGGGGGEATSTLLCPALGDACLESVLQASLALPQTLLGPAPAERPATAARRKAEEAASAALLRGQQLLAELEAELQALDGAGGSGGTGFGKGPRRSREVKVEGEGGARGSGSGAGPAEAGVAFWEAGRPRSNGARAGVGVGLGHQGGGDGIDGGPAAGGAAAGGSAAGGSAAGGSAHVDTLMDWSAQLQGVLAKMDALQTGYQAAAAAAAAGPGRPGSGGDGGGAAAASPGLSPSAAALVLRPGSARLRLEPLAKAPGLPAGDVAGQGRASGLMAATGSRSGGSQQGRPSSRGQVSGASAAVGGRDDGREAQAQDQRSGSTGGSEGEAEEGGAGAVPCAGHRIRQLRELQRHGIAGGGGSGTTGGDPVARSAAGEHCGSG